MAQAIAHLATVINCLAAPTPVGWTKLQDPDPFNSTELKKLWPFLIQFQLNFHDEPKVFQDHGTKVIFTISFSKGSTLDFFKPQLIADNGKIPNWLTDYLAFYILLKETFGPFNATADTEAKLEQLVMQDSHKVTHFFIDFIKI